MPDPLVNTRFDDLYRDFKTTRSRAGLSGDTKIGFRANATIDRKPLTRIMYVDHAKMRSRFSQPVNETIDHAAARQQLRELSRQVDQAGTRGG